MTISQVLIDLINTHFDNGYSASQIFSNLGGKVHIRTIYNWIDRFKEQQFSAKINPGRPTSVRTLDNILSVKNLLKARNSDRLISRKLKINRETVRRIIKQHLGLKPYRFVRCSKLTDKQKMKRKKFGGGSRLKNIQP